MINHDRDIVDLVEKFLDGRTTNAEERELYAWFCTHDVPQDWEPLKDMFAWYEAGMPERAEHKSAEPQSKVMPLRRWLHIVGGCAAVLAIVLLVYSEQGSDGARVNDGRSHVANNALVSLAEGDDDLLRRADLIEQEAYELLAWAAMNSL